MKLELREFEDYVVDKMNAVKSKDNYYNTTERAEVNFMWEILEEIHKFKTYKGEV